MNTPLITEIGFIALTLISYYFLVKALRAALNKSAFPTSRKNKILYGTIIGFLAWTIFISVLASTGFFSDFTSFPPRIGIILLVPLITILLITFSKTTKELLLLIPSTSIIKIQSFRVVV